MEPEGTQLTAVRIRSEIDWIACQDPEFLKIKHSFLVEKLELVRKELAYALGERRLTRTAGGGTWGYTLTIGQLRELEEDLTRMLATPSFDTECSYLWRCLRRASPEALVYVYKRLQDELELSGVVQPTTYLWDPLQVRFTVREYERVKLAAEKASLTVSAWLANLADEVDESDFKFKRLPKTERSLNRKVSFRVHISTSRRLRQLCAANRMRVAHVIRASAIQKFL